MEVDSRATTLELVSKVQQFVDMHEFMGDDDLDTALGYVVKLISKPDVPAAKAPELIVQLQAISAKMGMLASYYTNLEKDSRKKNVYYSMRDNLNALVDALKYVARQRF